MNAKIYVRFQLWIESSGGKSPAGARLFKGETSARFPSECVDSGGKFNFVFDDIDAAKIAAAALEIYLNATQEMKGKKAK